jgi:iron complex outermembrane receptor protein
MTKLGSSLLFATSILAFAASANAQDTAPAAAAPAPDSGNAGITDIIVTAQRRAENLTSVPLSISAQTGATLSASGIKQLSEVKFTTPGFLSSSGTGYTQIYIRGIGNGVFVGADPSVATFVDDIPHVYGSLVEDLVNVDRVEILKGAQGGLYGRNASGGVVNIITKQPSDKFSANARITGGNYGTLQASAYVNMPLNDRIAWNFSITRNQHNPYLKNVAPKTPYAANATVFGTNMNSLQNPTGVNKQNLWSFDTKLRVKLTDRLKVTLGVDYTDKHDTDGNGWITTNPAGQQGTYLFFMNTYAPTVVPYGCVAVGNCPPAGQLWPTLSNKSQKVYGAYANRSWTEDYGASAKVEMNTDFADLTSITAFRWNESHFQGDVGAGPVPIAGFTTHFQRRFFYQELRAVSNGSGPFRWLGGATYFHDHVDVLIASILLGYTFPPTISQYHTTNWSVYGGGSYDITDNLTFQASVRYAHETKTVAFPAPNASSATTVAHKFIPAATLSYKVPGGVIYARYAKGFKTGGPNPLVRPDRLPPGSPGLSIKPETVDTFEVGYRATLFDHKVQFTSAIFYNKYKNIHVTDSGTLGNTDISNALINLGTARTYGAEASIVWRVIPPVTLSANIGYLNAKYQKADFAGNLLLLPLHSSGNVMIDAPKWQGGFSVNLDQPLNDSTRLKGNILYAYIGHVYYTATQAKNADQPGYSLVNMRLGVTVMNDRLGLYGFVNNVFNKHFFVFGSSGTFAFENPGTPRLFGATAEFKF